MAEWLVVAGISVLIMATVGLVRQAASRGHSVLLFMLPLAGIRQVQENWEIYGLLALLRVLGFAAALAGLGLLYARHEAVLEPPGQVLRGAKTTSTTSFVGSQRAALLVAQGRGKALSGRIHGQSLDRHPRASLIHGVLSIEQGDGFLPDLSVSILLGWDGDDIDERRTLLITPVERNGPDIHLSWRPKGHSYPETRIFHGGYRLELALAPLDGHQLTGTLQLVMPDSLDSYLVGDFVAHTNNLLFLPNGKVDLSFDDPDTLGYVAEQYLQTQYPEGSIDHVKIEQVNLHRGTGVGEVQARIGLQDGVVERRRMNLEKTTVGWAVAPGVTDSEVLRGGTTDRATTLIPRHNEREGRPALPSARRLDGFPDLDRYVGRDVTLVDKNGARTQGRLESITEGHLRLRISVGAGYADIRYAADDLRQVILSDARVLTWGPVTEPPDSEPGERRPGAEQAPAAVPDGPWQALLGHNVVIHLHNGDTRAGLLRGLQADHVTLAIPMGAGTVEYSFDRQDVLAIEATRAPATRR